MNTPADRDRRQDSEVRGSRTASVIGPAFVEPPLVDERSPFQKDAHPPGDEDIPLRRNWKHEVVGPAVIGEIAIIIVQNIGAEADGQVVGNPAESSSDQRNANAKTASEAGGAKDVLRAEGEVRLDLDGIQAG